MMQGLKSEEHVLLVRKNATEARNLLLQHNAPFGDQHGQDLRLHIWVLCGMLQGLKSEEHVLLVRKNATEARNLLLQHNVPLVIRWAKTYDSTSECSVA